LNDCQVDRSGAEMLAKMIKTTPVLQKLLVLDLCCNPIKDEGVQALAASLLVSSHNDTTVLQQLHLVDCGITNIGAVALGDMLQSTSCCCLQILALSENFKVTNLGKEALLRGLSVNTSLVELQMYLEQSFREQVDHQLNLNRFLQQYMLLLSTEEYRLPLARLPHVFARVASKPSALFLLLQETRYLVIPHLEPEEILSSKVGSNASSKRKAPSDDETM
jgi:Ran GTPase-activating protein (RanGAP) involved in mRNA processing and transport